MSQDQISFKEMCARFDVTPRTLRYYEYIELLAPERVGRSRFYGPREIARMKLILNGRRWGFSLEEIRQWLLIYDRQGTVQQKRVMVEYAERQLKVLYEQRDATLRSIAELQELHAELIGELAEENDAKSA